MTQGQKSERTRQISKSGCLWSTTHPCPPGLVSALTFSATPWWKVLERVRWRSGNSNSWSIRSYPREELLEDLTTIWCMLLEDDQHHDPHNHNSSFNWRILNERCQIMSYLHNYKSHKVIPIHSGRPVMPPESEEISLYWWIHALILMRHGGEMVSPVCEVGLRAHYQWLLTPFVLGTYNVRFPVFRLRRRCSYSPSLIQYTLSYAPWPYHSLPLPLPSSSSSSTNSPSSLDTQSQSNTLTQGLSPIHYTSHTLSPRPTLSSLTHYFGVAQLRVGVPLVHQAATILYLASRKVPRNLNGLGQGHFAENANVNANPVVHAGVHEDEQTNTALVIPTSGNGESSRRWDADWWRLQECHDPFVRTVPHHPRSSSWGWKEGTMSGIWRGTFIVSPLPALLISFPPLCR